MRQPHGPGEIIEIDVIDAEPGVFGPSETPGPARVRRPRPRWLVPVAIGVLAVCGAVAMVWRPWEHPPEWRTFGPAAPAVSLLSDHLILDLGGADVTDLQDGQNLDAEEPTPLGQVFTVPGGTYDYDAWALFHARSSNSAGAAAASKSTELVRGLQANVRRVRVRTTVSWGSIGGNYWDVETNRLERDDALKFANAVGVVAGLPALAYGYNLHNLQPLGDVKTLTRVQGLAAHLAGEPVLSKFAPTIVRYDLGSIPVTVASIATDTDGLAMARFYLDQGRDVTVHGLPGAIIETRQIGKVVVWHEGDRLVVVAAEATDDQLLAMAQTVRPASGEEWDRLIAATAPEIERSDVAATTQNVAGQQSTTIASGSLAGGSAYLVSITLGNPTVICAHVGPDDSSRGACVYATPLSPSTHALHDDVSGAAFVVAVAPTGSHVLRITSVDGTILDVQLNMLDDTTWAASAVLPEGATYELLDPATPD